VVLTPNPDSLPSNLLDDCAGIFLLSRLNYGPRHFEPSGVERYCPSYEMRLHGATNDKILLLEFQHALQLLKQYATPGIRTRALLFDSETLEPHHWHHS
jgi:hypothetical protein